jgi:mono/diheme cytochrome c family protein
MTSDMPLPQGGGMSRFRSLLMMRFAGVVALAALWTAVALASDSKAEPAAKPAAPAPATTKTTTTNTSGKLYDVQDGTKVDAATLQGWKTWRAMACERCHGAEQEGLVGPSLIERLKVITKEQFHEQLMNGNPEKGMPPFASVDMVTKNWEGLYAYLKGRSDGQIKPGRLTAIEPK